MIDLNSKSNFIQWHYPGTTRYMIQFKTSENEGTPFQKVDISKAVQWPNFHPYHQNAEL